MYFKCNFSLISYNTQNVDVHFKCNFSLITYHIKNFSKKQVLISYNNIKIQKKVKKQNHKYDSAMDATPAPASSIAPKPFKVIPIAAKV